MNERKSYSKGIILTVPRSGSEALVECLDSHPDIRCESELLVNHMNNLDHATEIMSSYFDSHIALEENNRRIPRRVVCFKAMYMHLGDKSWKYIKDNKVKIIHLVRNNQFDRAVSDEFNHRKEETGRTHHSRTEEDFISLKIDRTKLQTQIEEYNKMIKDMEKELIKKDIDHIKVNYEEMFRNRLWNKTQIDTLPQKLSKRICDFFEIPFRPMSTTLVKQNKKPLSECIANWNELKDLSNIKL